MPLVTITAEAGQRVEDQKQFTGGGGIVAEGVYQAQLEMPDPQPPKSADKFPWMRVEGIITQGLMCNKPEENAASYVGRKSGDLFSFSPKSVGAMRALLIAAGVRYEVVDYQGGVQGLQFDTDHLCGKTIEFKVVHEADTRADARYPINTRWADLQPVGTYARANGGVIQGGQRQPAAQAAQAYTPGGYVPPAQQQVAAQQPAPAQQPQQGYAPQVQQMPPSNGQQPPPPNGYGR